LACRPEPLQRAAVGLMYRSAVDIARLWSCEFPNPEQMEAYYACEAYS
jgi:hypothetical protein